MESNNQDFDNQNQFLIKRAIFVRGKCQKTHLDYGLRLEETGPNSWLITDKISIPTRRLSGNSYDEDRLTGFCHYIHRDMNCPYCSNPLDIVCGACGKVMCGSRSSTNVCPHCGTKLAGLNEKKEVNLSGGDF